MSKQSAGILLYKFTPSSELMVFLVHPGGPFFKNKDLGAWSIPKGEFIDDEDALTAAKREFQEETGQAITSDNAIALNSVRLKSGKTVHAWAMEGDADADNIHSNTFPIEWPPKSGKIQEFVEVDRADWFDPATAKLKLNPAQAVFIDELVTLLYNR